MIKLIISILALVIFISCSSKTNYSGKIINQDSFNNIDYKNKDNLLNSLGTPSYVDPINKKFFYYVEKSEKKSAFSKNIDYSYIFVFEFNDLDKIIDSKVYDIKNLESIKNIEDQTSNEVVSRGILERIFGGVGPQQSIPTSP